MGRMTTSPSTATGRSVTSPTSTISEQRVAGRKGAKPDRRPNTPTLVMMAEPN
jgi:hypothetical protein